jgi:hypothetical protein
MRLEEALRHATEVASRAYIFHYFGKYIVIYCSKTIWRHGCDFIKLLRG